MCLQGNGRRHHSRSCAQSVVVREVVADTKVLLLSGVPVADMGRKVD